MTDLSPRVYGKRRSHGVFYGPDTKTTVPPDSCADDYSWNRVLPSRRRVDTT